MPDDLTNRVCAMDERAAAPTPAPDPGIDPGIDPNAINGPMGPGIGM